MAREMVRRSDDLQLAVTIALAVRLPKPLPEQVQTTAMAFGWKDASQSELAQRALALDWKRGEEGRAQCQGLLAGLSKTRRAAIEALLDEWGVWAEDQTVEELLRRLGRLKAPVKKGHPGWLTGTLGTLTKKMPSIHSSPITIMTTVTGLPDGIDLDPDPVVAPKATTPKAGKPSDRAVNVGFAGADSPDQELSKDQSLACGAEYYFWLQIGKPLPASIQTEPVFLPEGVPADARLEVAVFGFQDELRPLGADVAEVQLQPGGSRVTRPAAQPTLAVENAARLFFRVAAPVKPGRHHLRCNIYCARTLLQSFLVTARVLEQPVATPEALSSSRDYSISGRLDPAKLVQVPPNRLSLMLNQNQDGTHSIHLFGEHGFKNTATLNPQRLGTYINSLRGTLAQAAYGSPGPWAPGQNLNYRYDPPLDLNRLEQDVIALAVQGYRLFSEMVKALAGGVGPRDALQKLLVAPGRLQVAMKESTAYVFPAGLVYDYDFDTNASQLTLCDAFKQSLGGAGPLEQTPCFLGQCPNRESDNVVCPSGFWGFRHQLGLPVSVGPGDGDIPPTVSYIGGVDLLVSLSTDPDFVERDQHVQVLGALHPTHQAWWETSRATTLTALKSLRPHVVYFYCHGGVTPGGVPFILVGDKNKDQGITRDNLTNLFKKGGRWKAPLQPLVFINGCHTTALTPEGVMNLAEGFVAEGGASGVIGTEITIFEPLARGFAEDCLRRFFAGDEIGLAVRNARLALLARGNPLGLAYVPFVVPGLKLVPEAKA